MAKKSGLLVKIAILVLIITMTGIVGCSSKKDSDNETTKKGETADSKTTTESNESSDNEDEILLNEDYGFDAVPEVQAAYINYFDEMLQMYYDISNKDIDKYPSLPYFDLSSAEKFGYYFQDMDKDGNYEIFFLTKENISPYYMLCMYTLKDNKPVKVFQSTDSKLYNVVVYSGETYIMETVDDTTYNLYKLENGELVLSQTLDSESGKEEEGQFYGMMTKTFKNFYDNAKRGSDRLKK